MKTLVLLVVLFCQFFALAPTGFSASNLPAKPTSSIYVQDYAKVLSTQTKKTIIAHSAALDEKTKAQIVVVTIPSLQGDALEDYSLSLLRSWGIGDKQKNNGVLLLVAVNDRKSRIEVGYGLEGALPDGLTGRIQDQYMLPYFRQGDYDKGILSGYSALFNTTLKEYNLTAKDLNVRSVSSTRADNANQTQTPWWMQIALAGGLILLFIIDQMFLGGALTRLLFYLFLFGRGGHGGRGGGFGGGGCGGGSGGGGGSSRSW